MLHKGLTPEPRCYRQILLGSGAVGSLVLDLGPASVDYMKCTLEKEGETLCFNGLVTSSLQPKEVLLNLYLMGKLEEKTEFPCAPLQNQQTFHEKVPNTTQSICQALLPPLHHDNSELGALLHSSKFEQGHCVCICEVYLKTIVSRIRLAVISF